MSARLSALLAAPLLARAASAPTLTAADAWPTAVPFWPEYPTRAVTVLSGGWAFGTGAPSCDPLTLPYASILTPGTITVPSAFDVAAPGVLGPRRPCSFYRATHNCTPTAPALLKFSAVNFFARVFVDGSEVGKSFIGGYTPFEMLAPACGAGGVREVAVVVANTQNASLSPTWTGGDFFFYSGIIRPVIVTELPNMGGSNTEGAGGGGVRASAQYTPPPYWLDRLEPFTKDAVAGRFDLRVVLGGNVSAAKGVVHLTVAFNGGPPSPYVTAGVVNGSAMLSNLVVPPATYKPWAVGMDNTAAGVGSLFTLTIADNYVGDAITTRTALRALSIDTATSRITVNGQTVKLMGFNRHTMWPDTGAAVTPAQEVADLAILKSLNVNYVRGAHYPQSQSWLDLCDEAGIAMWEEALGPGTSVANMNDPWFMSNHLDAVSSMVGHSFAHPSVLLHAFFNEGPSNDPLACVGYARSASTLRDRVLTPGNPPARLITWANNQGSSDVCVGYGEDVISFNGYPGWYNDPGNVSYPPVFWGGLLGWAATTWPGMPLLVSETGGGGVWEWRNDTAPFPGPRWSQAYQTNLVTADAAYLGNASLISGLTLWQYSDIKGDDGSTLSCGQCEYEPHPDNLTVPWDCAYIDVSCGRPGGENHKGVVDFWRRQKEEFGPLSQIYARTAVGGGGRGGRGGRPGLVGCNLVPGPAE